MSPQIFIKNTTDDSNPNSLRYEDGDKLKNGDIALVVDSDLTSNCIIGGRGARSYLLEIKEGGFDHSPPDIIVPACNPGNRGWVVRPLFSGVANVRGDDSLIYTQDPLRDQKWLSIDRKNCSFSVKHGFVAAKRYLATDPSGISSNLNGGLLGRNSTLTRLSITCEKNTTAIFSLEKQTGNDFQVIQTITLENSRSNELELNVDLPLNTVVSAQILEGVCSFPILTAEIAWRLK